VDIINSILAFLGDVFNWIRNLAPEGFGLLVIPIGILGGLGFWFARKR
jgi:hypothetical protein